MGEKKDKINYRALNISTLSDFWVRGKKVFVFLRQLGEGKLKH